MDHEVERSSTTAGLPVAPSLGPTLVGIVTRSDLVEAHLDRLDAHQVVAPRPRRSA